MNGVPVPYGLGVLIGIGALIFSLLLVLFIHLILKVVEDEEHQSQLLNLSRWVLFLGVWFFFVGPIPDQVPTLLQLVIATVLTYTVLGVRHKKKRPEYQEPRFQVRIHRNYVDSDPFV